ncbi:MAG: tetratricopeptide repeat protein [Candidatus Coatesbacteria bacterium]|nr:tetratricopeptide repeat protein [Candidatus Coatesbacteria bacterium]
MLSDAETETRRLVVLVGLLTMLVGLLGCAGGGKEESRNHYESGCALASQGKYQEAMTAFNKAIAADPQNAEAHNGLGYCHLLLGQEEQGELHLKEALRLQPDLLKAVRNLATLYHRQTRMNEAIPLWEQLTETDPNDAEAWSYLSTAYISQNQIEKALVAAKRALECSPNNPTVIVNYANMQKALMKFDEAEQYYRRVVDMSPPDEQIRALAIIGLFDVYFLQADYSKAKVIGLKAKEDFPKDFRVYYNLALLHEKINENQSAAEYYEEAMKYAPNNSALFVGAGDFFSQIGNQDRANEIYRKAIDIDPKCVNAYVRLIAAGIERGGDLAEAERLCEKALSFAAQYEKSRLLDQMAVVKLKTGDFNAAIKYCGDALGSLAEHDKIGEATIRVHLAEIYKAKGDLASTKTELETVLALSPPENLLKEIEKIASDLPPEWVPNLASSEPSQAPGGSD